MALAVLLAAGTTAGAAQPLGRLPERVSFPSLDGRAMLVGFLFVSAAQGRSPAIVLLHGRSTVYAVSARGDYGAEILRRRDLLSARPWAAMGYVARIVESLRPGGYPLGFRAGSPDERPPKVDEATVRALDAYGALAFQRRRPEADGGRVGLWGWPNGASAALVAMAPGATGAAPVEIFIGDADEEVWPAARRRLAAKAQGGPVDLAAYPGATHDIDDPWNGGQDAPANVAAEKDATDRPKAFFAATLQP
jgi:carboxymethylenebutenolidase